MPINLSVRLCGAKARQNNHQPCRQPAMRNKDRCRLHGGKATGPRTSGGKERAARANFKHGRYTNDAMTEKFNMRMMMGWRRDLENI